MQEQHDTGLTLAELVQSIELDPDFQEVKANVMRAVDIADRLLTVNYHETPAKANALRGLLIEQHESIEQIEKPSPQEYLSLDEQQDEYEEAVAMLPDVQFMFSMIEHGSVRERITDLALKDSLCPIHFWDYCICFDDEEPECSQIRIIHPSHDT